MLLAATAAFHTGPLDAQSTGAYTAAQAAQGATIFAAQCSSCHGAKLEGGAGPALAGDDFMTKWNGETADDVHDVVANQMPLTAPGSLKPDEALAVVAYILQQNHYPAGSTPLSAATLKSVTIQKQH
jgi:alcohol dehydrogenase (cytochrome c)